MAYLGRQPIIGNYQVLDALTASATATYALTKNSVAVFPQTPANCIVSLNGVIQAPTDSYTISGSNIVFASALTGSDSIDFITVLGDVLNVGTVSDNTITTAKLADSSVSLAKLTATGTKDATTFLRGDNTFASAGGANTPYFYATLSADQTGLTNDTETKLTLATEIFDTGSEFDNAVNYRFTPANGNTYLVSGLVQLKASTAAVLQEARLQFKKNGSTIVEINQNTYNNNSTQMAPTFQYIITGNGSDYYELFGRGYVSSGTPTIGQRSFFTAFKLIG